MIKPGRTEDAAKAAASHTGSLTGSDAVLDAAFRRCGVLRVNTIEELFSMAEVLDKQPLPKGPKLAIITNAGGPSVIATDALVQSGGELSQPGEEAMEALNSFLPGAWSHNNPIDILGDASPERYAQTLETVNEDDNSDGTLVVLTPQAMTNPTDTAVAMSSRLGNQDKPVLASWMGGNDVEDGRQLLNRHNIPTFAYPDTAARAFSMMWGYSKNLQALYETSDSRDVDSLATIDTDAINQQLKEVRSSGRTLLTEVEAKELLAKYEITTTPTLYAANADEAAEKAESMGYPVVVKLHSTTITHKSDVGGVILNLHTAEGVRKAYAQIEASLQEKGLSAEFEGVTVQPMVKAKGTELLIGSTYDPQFGPVIAFGAGGTLVELFKDVAFGLPPLNGTLVKRMIEQTKISHALKGLRGQAPVDEALLEELLIRFSYLLIRHPMIKEIEMNPVSASGEGLVALDARVVLHEPETNLDDIQRHVVREYPYQYRQDWTDGQGQAMTIRPIRADDEETLVKFHQTLSEYSVYQTFAKRFPLDERITHKRLSRICFNDYDREIALVAMKPSSDGSESMAGIVRLSRQAIHQELAVFRLLISDAYHRQGLGRKLLQSTISVARQEGLSEIRGIVLKDNESMRSLCQSLGFTLENHTETADLAVLKL